MNDALNDNQSDHETKVLPATNERRARASAKTSAKPKPKAPETCSFCELIGKGVRPAGLYHEDQDCWIFPTGKSVTGVWKRHGETGNMQAKTLMARTSDTARAAHPEWPDVNIEVSENHHLVVEVKRGGRKPASSLA